MVSVESYEDCPRCKSEAGACTIFQTRTGEWMMTCDVCGWTFQTTLNNREALISGAETTYTFDFLLVGPLGIIEWVYADGVTVTSWYRSVEERRQAEEDARSFLEEGEDRSVKYTYLDQGVWMERDVRSGAVQKRVARVVRDTEEESR